MCGITACITLDRRQPRTSGPAAAQARAALETQLSKSLDLIAHRGPDAKGIWINDDATVGRLSLSLSTTPPLPLLPSPPPPRPLNPY
ncbi:uncharacterized protein THITE_2112612 [Thermothielavioides terrestris NRRL 8126]|jgi:asparagine synthase (glutamine-hydrolysing)|uniref:Glutamine amidotransferase type-2 domain-containing protein n=1 Tax=Thermothielavioides terrestris (strain ATCC 38088 / NRRL 8126) TaxID=578455 RepID=G2QZJ9_THETT|nr:uncharacterized protein THITE_2112612 [Thermothielavioides terrestris NRRL 8126]AEO65525.1 hypothetical protein THITE_2112612 [Thermothielavioides terrestris NRRL 8126]